MNNNRCSTPVRMAGAAALLLSLLVVGCRGDSAEELLASAQKSLDKHDARAAIIQAKNALQQQPENVEARFLLGQALVSAGDPASALIEFSKAEELGLPADRLAPDFARTMFQLGQSAKVLEKYRNVTLPTPSKQAQLQAIVASAYWARGKKDEGWAAINAAAKTDPDDRAVRLALARMQASLPPLDKAQAELEQLLKRHPDYADAWILKADLLSRAEATTAQAMEAYREALKHDKGAVGAHAGIVTLLLKTNDVAGAEKQLEAMRAVVPSSGQTGFLTALTLMKKGNLDGAREQLQLLLKRGPDNVAALHLAGAVEFQRGALLQAETHLNKALSQDPESVDIKLLLARVYLRAGEGEKALLLLQPLTKSSETSVELYPLLAEIYLERGDTLRAEQMFTKAVSLNSADVPSRVALIMARLRKKISEADIAELRTIAASSRGTIADLALASILIREKRFEPAGNALDGLAKKNADAGAGGQSPWADGAVAWGQGRGPSRF